MSVKWRSVIAGVILLFVVFELVPNFVDMTDRPWPTKGKLSYGLDIQGGAHLVMGVDVDAVMGERTERLAGGLSEELATDAIVTTSVSVVDEKNHEIKIVLANPQDLQKAVAYLERYHTGTLAIMSSAGSEIVARLSERVISDYRKQVVDQAIEVIRNRIDEFGVAEPSIVAQGENRVLVQLPGIKDSARAKDLINRTARLDFRMVYDEVDATELNKWIEEAETAGGYKLGQDGMTYAQYVRRLNEDLVAAKKLPEKTMVAFEKLEGAVNIEAAQRAYLLRTDSGLGGDQLEDAFVTFDEMGQPQVTFRLSVEGRRLFADITGANVNKLMAIVLDDVVKSAPVIKGRIDSDRAVITVGDRNYDKAMAESQLIATALRAGALPARLEQLEERTVGPTLGADSISKAKSAGLVAFALILVFMVTWYRSWGMVASVAMLINVACLLAVLTGLGATLTLPGIAGIILTLGMAVDANIIIFERIKEELQKGSSFKLAVKEGFSNAFSAIVDSNLTGAIVALILFYYGTGPVRGFAVTLVAGIVTSMFTAVFLSRLMMDILGDRIAWVKKA